MDWSRIKTILILVLLITNVLLGATYVQSKMAFEREREDQLDRVVALFERNGIGLDDINLDFPKKLSAIAVSFEGHTEAEVQKFLGSDYVANNNQYIKGNSRVVLGEMSLYYELREIPDEVYDQGLPNEAITDAAAQEKLAQMVDETISTLGYAADYKISGYFERGDYIIVNAKQVYKDYIMDDALMTFIYYRDSLVALRRTWLSINNDNSTNKYDIISVDRALYVTLPKLDEGDAVAEIGISYKLNDSVSVVSNLISGEALPFYRIAVSDGSTYYVRAIAEN
jgi:regulatory protein YycI of two-component signal transduction system YycFG